MATVDPEPVATKTLKGFQRADVQYTAMSGGWRLHTAPECFAVVEIAKQIVKPGSRYVTLEQNINDAVGWSGGKRFQGSAGSLPASGRFDIAIWGAGTDWIQGVVEVKLGRWFTYSSIAGDIERLCEALDRARDLQWGMSAFHFACWTEVEKSGRARLEDRTRKIVHRAKEYAKRNGATCREFLGNPVAVEDWNGLGGGCAGGAVLLFERQ